jgi:hypothetical protein
MRQFTAQKHLFPSRPVSLIQLTVNYNNLLSEKYARF